MSIRPIEILIRAKDQASGVFGTLDGKLKALGAAIAGYFGVKAFAGVINGAAEFEAALSKVQAATGASAAEMGNLKKAAEDAGANTKFTAVEAAGALEELAKSGLSATDAIKTLPAVLNLAQAGGIGLAQASEYMTSAVAGLGLSFDDAGRVADVLAKGANASKTSVTGLAQALSYAAPVANSVGLSLEATVAIIGKFADGAIDASRAGTALNSILSQFINPASKFREELAAAGITTTDFEQALHELAAAGPAGSKAINAVGQEAGPALRALLNQGMGSLDELKIKLNDAAGSAKETAATIENNLNGSFKGLASAWDTVSNVLGTPVLPVLKSAVDQLAGALRGAVSDGTVQKFGEAIAAAFQSGATWARAFLATIDFTQLAVDLRAFADRAGEAFTQIGEYATNAGNIVKLVYGVMSAGTNTVMGAVYLIGEAFAGVASNIQSGLALLYDAFAKITFGNVSAQYKQMADDIRLSADATMAASEELGRKSTAAFMAVADGAQLARDGFAGLTTGVGAAKPVVDASSKAIADMARQIEEVGQKTAAAKKATEDKSAADQAAKQAVIEHGAALEKLRAEYAALIAKGDLQGAVEKFGEINTKLQATPAAAGAANKALGDTSKAAANAAAAIESAYQDLGITTDASLREVAKRAKTSFDLLAQSGTASARELAQGFEDMAKKAIAANDGVADSTIKAKAAMYGYKIEVDAAGKATLVSADTVKKAGDAHHKTAQAVTDHRTALEKLNDERDREISALEKTNQLNEREAELYRQKWKMDKEGYSVDANGKRIEATGQTQQSLYNDAKQAGLTAEQSKKLADEYAPKRTAKGYSEFNNNKFWEALNALKQQRDLDAERQSDAQQRPLVSPPPPPAPRPPVVSPAPPPPAVPPARPPASQSGDSGTSSQPSSARITPAPTYISNITIPGVGSSTLRFADASSQSQGEDLLRKLAQAKGVAQ